MANTIVTGPSSWVYVDGFDLSGQTKTLSFDTGTQTADARTWADSNVPRVTTGYQPQVTISGLWAADGSTQVEDALAGAQGIIVSFAAAATAEGDYAQTVMLERTNYKTTQAPNDLIAFSVAGMSGVAPGNTKGQWTPSRLMAPKASRSTSGNGTGVNMGVASSSKRMVAAVHVFSVGGTSPTLDVEIESDDSSGFASPTSRITLPQMTAPGSAASDPVAGPGGSDSWWRAKWTIGGTSPSFEFAVTFGWR